MPGPESEQLLEILSSVFTGAKVRRMEDVVVDLQRTPDTREKARSYDWMNLLMTKGDRNIGYLLQQILQAENDLGEFDFGLKGVTGGVIYEYPNLKENGISPIFDLARLVTSMTAVKGYGEYQQVRGSLGSTVMPATLAMIPVWGIHELPVIIEDPAYPHNMRPATASVNFADVLGHMAYRQRMTDLYMKRDQTGYIEAIFGMATDIFAKQMGITPDEVERIIYADCQTAVGDSIKGRGAYGRLRELMTTFFVGAEAFLNVMTDSWMFSQSIIGSHAAEHSRSEIVGYFEYYKQTKPEILPEANLVSLFDGLLSRFSKKGLAWVGSTAGDYNPAAFPEAERPMRETHAKRRKEALENIMMYEAKAGEADIIESDFIYRRLGRNGNGVDELNQATQSVNVFKGTKHLISPDLWEARALLFEDDRWEGFNFDDMYRRMLRNGGHQENGIQPYIDAIPVAERTGLAGFRRFIHEAANRGVAIMDFNQFNSRDWSDVLRYAERVAASTKVFKQAGDVLTASTGTIGEDVKRLYSPAKQLEQYDFHNSELIKGGVELIAKSFGGGEFLGFTDIDNVDAYMSAYVQGVMRAHLVLPITDNTTQLIDIDWGLFSKSQGKAIRAQRLTREMVYAKVIADGGTVATFEAEFAKAGCRWVTDSGSEKGGYGTYAIGTSGRPLFKTTTTAEQYNKMGTELRLISSGSYGALKPDELGYVRGITKEYDAITKFKHNRFSIGWVTGQTPFSMLNIIELIENLEDAQLLKAPSKSILTAKARDFARRGYLGVSERNLLARAMKEYGILPFAPPSAFGPGKYTQYLRDLR